MAIPDGGPLSSVGRKRGHANMERTTGPSYMGEILKISAEKGYRHYFYGSTEQTLEKLYKALNENYPGIQIAGMYSPPFRPTSGLLREKSPTFLYLLTKSLGLLLIGSCQDYIVPFREILKF